MDKKYEFLEHTADIKFKVYGKKLNELFENSVLAVSSILAKGNKIKSLKKKKINIEGKDNENLMYQLVDEIIFLLDAENFIVSKAKLKVSERKIEGEVAGDDSKKYKDLDHIKAATYAEMYVKKTSQGFEAQVVVDV